MGSVANSSTPTMDCTRRIPSESSGGMLSSSEAYCNLAPYIIGVWGVLRLFGFRVVVFHSKVFNVVIHGEADRALGVNGVFVSLQINAAVKVSLPVLSEVIVFGKSLLEVYGVSLANALNVKSVNEQAKNYWDPSVSPETRCEGELVVVVKLEALF